jgi:hypothetical protein
MRVIESRAAMLSYASQVDKSSNKSFRRHSWQALRQALTRFAAVFDRSSQADAAIADRYGGHSWTDSTERLLFDDIEKSGF